MPIKSSWTIAILFVFFAFSAKAQTTRVEVFSGGDDGLTQRFRDASEKQLNASSEFTIGHGKKPGTLVATIPTHVRWTTVGKRTQVFYTVQFTSTDGRNLRISTGSCWDDNIGKCATRAFQDTRRAAKKLHYQVQSN